MNTARHISLPHKTSPIVWDGHAW